MKTMEIAEAIVQLKDKRTLAKKLDREINSQKKNVLIRLSVDLEDMGLSIQEYSDDNNLYIQVENDDNICVRFIGTNLVVECPNLFRVPFAQTQILIYKAITNYEEELTNIQLDKINHIKLCDWEDMNSLIELMTEDLFNTLESGGVVEFHKTQYTMNKTSGARYEFTMKDEYSNETKKYLKSQIVNKLKDIAREEAHKVIYQY